MLAVNDHEFVVHDGVITIPSDRHFLVGKKGCRCVPAASASTTTRTATPRLYAASNASAMGLLVKEYPATSISLSAAAIPFRISWRDSPFGEKAISERVSASASDFGGHAVRHSRKSDNPAR